MGIVRASDDSCNNAPARPRPAGRIKTVGLGEANCHTFRATGITAYLLNGGTLERA